MFPALYKYKHHSLFSYCVFMAYPVAQVHTNSDILFLLSYSNYFSLSFCIRLQQHIYVLTRSLLQSKCSLLFQSLSLLRSPVVHLLFKDIRFSLVFLLLCPPLLIQFSEKGPILFWTASCTTIQKLGSNSCILIRFCVWYGDAHFLLSYYFLKKDQINNKY